MTLLVANRPDIGAIVRAERAGVPAVVLSGAPADSAGAAAEILDLLESRGIEWIALAGYLKLIPARVIERYRHRIVNIHPALLPGFGGRGMYGLRVHSAVLESGARVTGATVHLVDERYDEGRIIAQWPVPVLPGDSAERLAERVLRVEHLLYPLAIEMLLAGRAELELPREGAFALIDAPLPSLASLRSLHE